MTNFPLMGVVKVTWPVFLNLPLIVPLELVKLSTSNFVCWLIHRSITACMIYYLQKRCVHVTSLNFGK